MFQAFSPPRLTNRQSAGFTLVELMVSMAVLILLLVTLMAAVDQTSRTFKNSSSMIEAFAKARAAFDIVNQSLSQATLNTYWDYYNAAGVRRTQAAADTFVASAYGRASDLRFLVRQNAQYPDLGQEVYFQTPEAYSADSKIQDTQGLLNACGYFVRYGNDAAFRPSTVNAARWRFRLMQAMEPTENLQVFRDKSSTAWVENLSSAETSQYVRPIADNVIALIVWPRLSQLEDALGNTLAASFVYDSGTSDYKDVRANQLPPVVQLTLICIDEDSAVRIDTRSDTPPGEIQTALKGRFTDVTRYQDDIDSAVDELSQKKIRCRVFTTSVVMRESKWSSR